ncbi:Uncharacterised protein [Shigella sonnei]|nr:Uncharacterised protein [Shigella sonnei]
MAVQLDPHWIVFPPLPGLTEQLHQHAVMRCFGNGEMELHITTFAAARRAGSQLTLFQLQCLTHFDDIFAGSLQSGKFRDVTFQ